MLSRDGPFSYACRRDFFRVIDSETKAYWLGFLAADGCVGKRGDVQLYLQVRDAAHLEKFRAALQAGHPVRFQSRPDGRRAAYLAIVSTEMASDLVAHGLTPRKSLRLRPPQTVPLNLQKHFWRGVFDGDGSVGKYVFGTGPAQWRISLNGTAAMIEGFRSFVAPHCGTNASVIRGHRCFQILIAGNRMAVRAMRVLYQDATVFLDRKMSLYRQADA